MQPTEEKLENISKKLVAWLRGVEVLNPVTWDNLPNDYKNRMKQLALEVFYEAVK